MPPLHAPKAILWAGMICGGMDIISACIDVGVRLGRDPVWLLQAVAGAVLGPATFQGGLATAALGLLMHFTVAFSWAALFYLSARRFPGLLRGWAVPAGLVLGTVVFFVMYRVVYPLTIELKSLYLTTEFNHAWPALRWSQYFVHLGCVGLPIALSIRAKGIER